MIDTYKFTMKYITSGGYQIYDPFTYPVEPDPESTCFSKLEDLEWKDDEFKGKTVSDLACSLGFFTFIALSKGAKSVVGYDAYQHIIKFAQEMQKIQEDKFPETKGKIEFIEQDLSNLPELPKTDIVVCNAIVHWLIIKGKSLEDCLLWLHKTCNEAVYFEGCIDAKEEVMQKYGVTEDKLNPKLFDSLCRKIFGKVKYISIPKYNSMRVVVRLYK